MKFNKPTYLCNIYAVHGLSHSFGILIANYVSLKCMRCVYDVNDEMYDDEECFRIGKTN